MKRLDDNILAIVQGRMGSSRFPGKTLYKLNGRPSLEHLINSVNCAISRNNIIVATSTLSVDDEIVSFCHQNDINVFRGSPENVASRFYEIISSYRPKYFIRLNGDSPLFDYRIILQLRLLLNSKCIDLVSTFSGRRFPSGMNAELVKTDTFLNYYRDFRCDSHFEHVTRYFYDYRNRFNIVSLDSSFEFNDEIKFSFDTFDDKIRLEKIFSKIKNEHYLLTLEDKFKIYKELFQSA